MLPFLVLCVSPTVPLYLFNFPIACPVMICSPLAHPVCTLLSYPVLICTLLSCATLLYSIWFSPSSPFLLVLTLLYLSSFILIWSDLIWSDLTRLQLNQCPEDPLYWRMTCNLLRHTDHRHRTSSTSCSRISWNSGKMFGKIKERELGQQRERERKRGNESEKEREIDHEEEIGRGVAR